MPHSPKDSYRILELNPDASLEAVKRSYRSLVKLWHPDRYTPGSSMQGIAQEKIKDINGAYADLCKRLTKEAATSAKGPGPIRSAYAAGSATRDAPPPRRPSRPVETAPPPQRPRASGRPETADQEQARTAPRRKPEMRDPESAAPRPNRSRPLKKSPPLKRRPIRSIRPIILSVFGVGLGAALVISVVNRWSRAVPEAGIVPTTALRSSSFAEDGEVARATESRSGPIAAQADPTRRERTAARVESEAGPIRRTEFAAPAAQTTGNPPLVPAPQGSARTFSSGVFEDLPMASRPIDPAEKPFWLRSLETATEALDAFTFGTSRAEVIKLQGRPDRETPSLLCFGSSTVSLSGGKVVAWYRGDTPLKAREEPEIAYDLAATFTVGSSKAEVIGVQGPPQHASENVFQYGSSTVEFRDGRVWRWREGVPALHVHVMPEASYGRSDRFTVGATRAQVIAIQGRPDFASESILQYGTAKIFLRDGLVTAWQDRIGLLRARLVTAGAARPGP